MENNKTPTWLQELLDKAESEHELQVQEMNKLRADQTLAAIGTIEDRIHEIQEIAQQEVELVNAWRDSQVNKLQRQISWLARGLEFYIRNTGDATISLAHGVLKIRKSRDTVAVVDFEKFLPVGQKLGLIRTTEPKYEADLNAIRAFLKANGNKPPAGISVTVGQPTFSFTTIKKGSSNGQDERTETEDGRGSEPVTPAEIAAR